MLEVAQILSHFIHIMLVFPWCFSGASVVLNSRGLGPKFACLCVWTFRAHASKPARPGSPASQLSQAAQPASPASQPSQPASPESQPSQPAKLQSAPRTQTPVNSRGLGP